MSKTPFGQQLQSCSFSKMEEKEEEWTSVTIIGVLESEECSSDSFYELRLEDGRTLFVDHKNGSLWTQSKRKGKALSSLKWDLLAARQQCYQLH
ncbi:hypothetical protein CHARACLAT_033011 [Characodon lateralis]|uniref:Uncharacterized protein n=1 Tax=Characodon lateralis TaxID=208331 RepID=A0ABU7CTS8_9TELE|nr:hypothetical protein [Characodon lateralis]